MTNRTTTAALAVSLLLAACSGNAEEPIESGLDGTAVTTSVTEGTAATTIAVTDTAPEATPTAEFTLTDVFDPIGTEATEAVPRPLLAWEAVEGAALYQVVVLGSDGDPYWAWSGPETMINVGGSAEPDAIGAWVHEPMTWTVSAQGPDGEVLGLSAPADLEP